jgi:hypothetical protein
VGGKPMYCKINDSPVEEERKLMPRGDGNWPGYNYVYSKLQEAAEFLARDGYTRIGYDHVRIMAAMGSGHEETMKGLMGLAMAYGWCKVGEEKFSVKVTNEILGNSERIMTIKEIKKFNLVAIRLARLALKDSGTHSDGMWTVEKVKH